MHLRAVRALAFRPELWPTAVMLSLRLARPGWWRRWPPRPQPDPAYLAFRMQTAYGSSSGVPSAQELIDYLEWCRRMAAMGQHRGRSEFPKLLSLKVRRRRASVAAVSPEPPAADPR